MTDARNRPGIWVVACELDSACCERLGDARRLADEMDLDVGVLIVAPTADESKSLREHQDRESTGRELIRYGADLVMIAPRTETCTSQAGGGKLSAMSKVDTAIAAWKPLSVRIVFAGGDPDSREWASLLAAKTGCQYISPTLVVRFQAGHVVVTQLDSSGRKSRRLKVPDRENIVVTMRETVGEAIVPDDSRQGETKIVPIVHESDTVTSRVLAAAPATSDIRFVKRLIAGGRGLGSKQGFGLLRDVAGLLRAGVAASRMAVDSGWIEAERQVGQTGKTVTPDVYIACGISGASHHLDGMRGSSHVIAINTDANAPIMARADLALVADLYPVLEHVKQRLEGCRT